MKYRILNTGGTLVVATCDAADLVATLNGLPYTATGGYTVQALPDPDAGQADADLDDEVTIQEYLQDWTPTYDATLGSIETCVRIIGCYEPNDEQRNEELVQAAFESICSWAGDYGVDLAAAYKSTWTR